MFRGGHMPIYEYMCSKSHRFELRQSFDAETVASCPKCSSSAHRVINAVSVHYKGSGFYSTDHGRSSAYKTDSKKQSDGADGTPISPPSKATAPTTPLPDAGKAAGPSKAEP